MAIFVDLRMDISNLILEHVVHLDKNHKIIVYYRPYVGIDLTWHHLGFYTSNVRIPLIDASKQDREHFNASKRRIIGWTNNALNPYFSSLRNKHRLQLDI